MCGYHLILLILLFWKAYGQHGRSAKQRRDNASFRLVPGERPLPQPTSLSQRLRLQESIILRYTQGLFLHLLQSVEAH